MLELIRVDGGPCQSHLQDRGAGEELYGLHHQVLEDGIARIQKTTVPTGDWSLKVELRADCLPRRARESALPE